MTKGMQFKSLVACLLSVGMTVRAAEASAAEAAASPEPAATPTASVSEIEQLKKMLLDQQRQLAEQQRQIAEQQKQLDVIKGGAATAQTADSTFAPKQSLGEVASLAPIALPKPASIAPSIPAPSLPASAAASAAAQGSADQDSPLQIKIGGSTITPVGFMDLTNTWRSTNAGTSLQTNFGSFPYNNTTTGTGRLTEDKLSAENSRLGLRVDAAVKGMNVMGYFEGDFVGGVGNGSNNTQVSSNSMLFRIRQYYVDVRKGFWEVLAGQAWSFLTPNRNGLGVLPADLFYSNVVDVNYMNGLYWGRIPGIRFIGHPSKTVSFGIALENSTQYAGGSGGGAAPVLPSAIATAYGSQIDNGTNNDRTLPNVHPDIIAKIAFQPNTHFHWEFGGVESTAKVWNPTTNTYFTKAGAAMTTAGNVEVAKNFRVVTNNFFGNGEGRYLFGVVPDFIVRSDGSLSMMRAMSTVSGIEHTMGSLSWYSYYGGIYAGRDTARDVNGSLIGYGYSGSANSQNRSVQEITTGFNKTLWRDAKYGALNAMGQYAYFFRNPWYVATGAPKNAHETAIWFNLRYTLPGSAPTIKN